MATTSNLKVIEAFPLTEVVELGTVVLQKKMSLEEFLAIVRAYPNLNVEREKNGKVTIMSPVKFGSGKKELHFGIYLGNWWLENDEKGEVFSSATGIMLEDTSFKSPDCGWISEERLALNPVEDENADFLKVAPDFVIEIKSLSDSIKKLKNKMANSWIKNGVRLAWLIDPYKERAYIYRPNQAPKEIKGFDGKFLSGEDVLVGFELNLEKMKMKQQKRKL